MERLCREVEADELWSFVARKKDKQWVWLAFDRRRRQVLAFYVGERSRRQSAKRLWARIPRGIVRMAGTSLKG